MRYVLIVKLIIRHTGEKVSNFLARAGIKAPRAHIPIPILCITTYAADITLKSNGFPHVG